MGRSRNHLRLVVDNQNRARPDIDPDAITLHELGIDGVSLTCGVDTGGLVNWAAPRDPESGRRIVDVSLRDREPSALLAEFCGDCEPVFRARAEIAGTCQFAQVFARTAVLVSAPRRVA